MQPAVRILFAFLLLCGSAIAAKPVAVISGPTSGRPGDLIVLSGEGSVGTHKTWRVWIELIGDGTQQAEALERLAESLRKAGYVVTSPAAGDENKSLTIEAGSKLVLASYPGTYRAALAVGDAEGVDLALWTVVVTGNTAPPAPPDEPPSDPPEDPPSDPPSDPPADPPDPPAATFFKQVDVDRWMESVLVAKRVQRAALAAAFRTAGQAAVDGKYDTVKKAEAAGNAAIKAAVLAGKLDHVSWSPFGETVSAAVDALKATGKISTPQEYGQALLELAGAMSP